MDHTNEQARRWQQEAAFFDEQSRKSASDVGIVDQRVIDRYTNCSTARARYPVEYAFALAGDLKGKRVLDVGCGEGANSVLIAKLGATVVGVDISPGAIDVARRRATLNNVSDRVHFEASPLESFSLVDDGFDIIWCEAFLHHVIEDLSPIVERLFSHLRPGGLVLFLEPVSLSRLIRGLRRIVPITTAHTPDERPLQRRELAAIAAAIPNLHTRFFHCFGRLNRFVLSNGSYERSTRVRRELTDAFCAIDAHLFSLPGGTGLASVAVMHARRAD